METYLGLDLGGTKLLIGEVDSHGNILRYKKYDSGYFNQQAASEIIKSSLDDYIRTVGWCDQKPVGMGSTLSPGANISQCRIMNESGRKCYLKYNYGRNPCLLLVVFVILTPKLN